jgi:hypothetical protein
MNKQKLGALLATVTSERVRQLVLELEPRQAKATGAQFPYTRYLKPSARVSQSAKPRSGSGSRWA